MAAVVGEVVPLKQVRHRKDLMLTFGLDIMEELLEPFLVEVEKILMMTAVVAAVAALDQVDVLVVDVMDMIDPALARAAAEETPTTEEI